MEPLQKYNRRDICFFGILRTPRHDFWMITSKIAGGIFFIHAFPFGDLFEKRKCEKWSILQIFLQNIGYNTKFHTIISWRRSITQQKSNLSISFFSKSPPGRQPLRTGVPSNNAVNNNTHTPTTTFFLISLTLLSFRHVISPF